EFRASAKQVGDLINLNLEIVDTGNGIPEADLEEIRKPFQRGTTKDFVEEGSGLGLSIVERLLHLMHGSLDIESEVGKGSSFRVSVQMRVSALSAL
ncbi:MAG: ATP-binding protein, partial [Verrucomicrobiota bacterium]